jgi:hypothetical protein
MATHTRDYVQWLTAAEFRRINQELAMANGTIAETRRAFAEEYPELKNFNVVQLKEISRRFGDAFVGGNRVTLIKRIIAGRLQILGEGGALG